MATAHCRTWAPLPQQNTHSILPECAGQSCSLGKSSMRSSFCAASLSWVPAGRTWNSWTSGSSQNSPSLTSGIRSQRRLFLASTFLQGDAAGFPEMARVPEGPHRRHKFSVTPRAADEKPDDVPAFKGFPPMQEKPRIHWRLLAALPYTLPVMEAWMYAETAFNFYGPLEAYEFLTYPIMGIIGSLPQWFMFVYFFAAYLGVVRNNRFPHFLRFHVVNSMLMEILLQVVGTCNDWIPPALYWGKLGGIFWMVVAISFIATVIDCIRCALSGMYADVPFLCDAAYLQIPYET